MNDMNKLTNEEVIHILTKICFVYIVDNPNEVDEIHEAKMRLIKAFEEHVEQEKLDNWQDDLAKTYEEAYKDPKKEAES